MLMMLTKDNLQSSYVYLILMVKVINVVAILLIILTVGTALERGFARPDESIERRIRTEHRTLVDFRGDHFNISLDGNADIAKRVGLSISSIEMPPT